MDDANRNPAYFLIRGFINGHEKNSVPVNALFLGVSGTNLRFLKTRFTRDPIEMDIPSSEMTALLDAPRKPAEDDSEGNADLLQRYEERMYNFIKSERIFIAEKRSLDAKAIERAITHFCAGDLEISAITFVEVTGASAEDVLAMIPGLNEKTDKSNDGAEEEDGEGNQAETGGNTEEIFIECNVVIDPVAGLPASKLRAGQEIRCRLPEKSPFYEICKSNLPDFDGVVSGKVTGVKTNEFGNSVISISLADGITGVMKVQGNVWIKTERDNAPHHKNADGKLTRYMLLGAAGAALLLLAIVILFHFMN
jgi:hypothetical protein